MPTKPKTKPKKLNLHDLFERWKARQIEDQRRGGLRFTVQYIWPVDNPVYNVGMKRSYRVFHFFVPINHPDAHTMGFSALLDAAHLSDLHTQSTAHNNKTPECTIVPVRAVQNGRD